MKRIKNLALLTALAMGIVIGTQLPRLVALRDSLAQDPDGTATRAEVMQLQNTSRAFVAVSKLVSPSVVGISSRGRAIAGDTDPLELLYGPPPGQAQSTGTGVILDASGYILTNNHVVQGADTLVVTLSDNRELPGKIVGVDPDTDIAVVKIEAENLRAAQLGDSDKAEVGDWVVAIGNPFGLSSTVTAGIISAKGRSNVGVATYEGFIQTDAAINPGNSGGPLVNLEGNVIGITTAILSRSGGYQGIGFAIPINRAKYVMTHLIRDGKVQRGYLGVEMTDIGQGLVALLNDSPQNLNIKSVDELVDALKLKAPDGAFIFYVMKPGPAAKAGLQVGDVIVAFGGKPIHNSHDLSETVAIAEVGKVIPVKALRDGKAVEVQVTVAERPARPR